MQTPKNTHTLFAVHLLFMSRYKIHKTTVYQIWSSSWKISHFRPATAWCISCVINICSAPRNCFKTRWSQSTYPGPQRVRVCSETRRQTLKRTSVSAGEHIFRQAPTVRRGVVALTWADHCDHGSLCIWQWRMEDKTWERDQTRWCWYWLILNLLM